MFFLLFFIVVHLSIIARLITGYLPPCQVHFWQLPAPPEHLSFPPPLNWTWCPARLSLPSQLSALSLPTSISLFYIYSDKTSAYRIAQERNSIVQLFPKSLKYLKSINCLSFALLKVEKLLDLFCILCIVKVNRLQAQQLSYWKYFLQGLANSSRGNAEEGRIKLLLLRSYLSSDNQDQVTKSGFCPLLLSSSLQKHSISVDKE